MIKIKAIKAMIKCFMLFLFWFFLFSLDTKQFAPSVEVFLHDESHALRVQAVLDEVAVVGLVVHLYCQVAVGEEQVADVEVADE